MFERPKRGQNVVLVHVHVGQPALECVEQEFAELAKSADADIQAQLRVVRQSAEPKLFIGKGKAEELAELVQAWEADLVLVNAPLSPSQERNLERLLCCRVLDRAGLILDIFAQRARTHEGKLQVELAQLRHLSTRLVRGWTHLERQKGGIGLRGPGETQLETDRRLLAIRVKGLEKKLVQVRARRAENRKPRQKQAIPTIALVGYTNAGKSTLFNRLAGEDIYAADQLFATLDPTLRKIMLPSGKQVILADTVGFVRDLPHELVAAFRSTLEETTEADLLLHVVDCADPEHPEYIEQVNLVLEQLGAQDHTQLMVFNKVDAADRPAALMLSESAEQDSRVWLSAHSGAGVDLLFQAIEQALQLDQVQGELLLQADEGRLRADLFSVGAVHAEQFDESGWRLQLKTDQATFQRLCARQPGLSERLQ